MLFVNGLGFEGWMTRLVEAADYKGPVIVVSEGVKPRQMEEDGQEITDPHAWQDLNNGILYAGNIAAGLCKADPRGLRRAIARTRRPTQAELTALDGGKCATRSRRFRPISARSLRLTMHSAISAPLMALNSSRP